MDTSLPLVKTSAIVMEANDEKSLFLDRLKYLRPEDVLYHKENLGESTGIEMFNQKIEQRKKYNKSKSKKLKGIDFDDLKHLGYHDLSTYIDDVNGRYKFGRTVFGRFLRGSISINPYETEKVGIIKTWDLKWPPRRDMDLQVVRLHNELTLFMKLKLKTHPCLPKLIGYSIDKRLAVIYDLDPYSCLTLLGLLEKHDGFDWEYRLWIAFQVAHMMCYFHEDNITIGSIDSMNMIFDEDGVLKLCDFGLTAQWPNVIHGMPPWTYVSGRCYRDFAEKLFTSDGNQWTTRSDIFAFGNLLLELILCSTRTPIQSISFVEVLPSGEVMPDNFGPLDTSIIKDADLGFKVRKLAWKCMQENPSNRPDAKEVVDELTSFMGKEEIDKSDDVLCN